MRKQLKIELIVLVFIFIGMLGMGAPFLPAFTFCAVVGVFSLTGDWLFSQSMVKRTQKKYAFIAGESIFNNSILVLAAVVMQADGKEGAKELKYVEAALKIHFSPKRVIKQMIQLTRLFENKHLDYVKVCKVINYEYTYREKIQLIHFLIGIVCSDGLLTKKEQEILQYIAARIKLTPSSLNAIFGMFNFITEGQAHNRQRQREQRVSRSSAYKLSQSYSILGINENSTDKEVKKAYRNLAKIHHPDRLIHLGEEHQKSAKEKFQAILEAYETIKTKRGFS